MDWGDAGTGRGRLRPRRLRRASACCRRSPRRAGSPAARCRSSATAWAARSRSGSRRARPDDVSALVTIGAPWDFASTSGIAGGLRAMIRAEGRRRAERAARRPRRRLRPGAGLGLPDALRAGQPDPGGAEVPEASPASTPTAPAARLFVALEDWLADGVPMPVGAAKDLLVGWQIRNLTATGALALPRRPGRPAARSRRPALVFCGERDTIAPPPLAAPARPRAAAGRDTDAPAHRPRRHGGRQRRARRRSGGRWRPSSPCRHRRLSLEPLPLCDEGRADAPGGEFVLDRARPERDPPARGGEQHDQHRHRLGRAHAGRQLQRRLRQHARRTSSAPR